MTDEPADKTSARANCKVCCEPINPKAKKCTKCGSFQDWSRHLLRFSAILVSLFALAPLWTISSSLTKLVAPQHKAAQIQAAVTGCGSDEVRVVFENSGQISGIVTGAHFAIERNGVRSVPELEVLRSDGGGDIIVTPLQPPVRASYRAYIDGTPASFLAEPSAGEGCSYLLKIDWIDFAGSHRQLQRECPCP